MTTDRTTNPNDRENRRDAAHRDADDTPTDYPAGEEQARQNAEEELPG